MHRPAQPVVIASHRCGPLGERGPRPQRYAQSGFAKTVDDINEWQKLDQKARTAKMYDTLGLLLASAQSGSAVVGSLTPPQANTAISRLRAAGINSASLNRAIRKLAGTAGKPPVAEDINNFLIGLTVTKDASSLVDSPVTRESKLTALSAVLGYFEADPTLGLLAADLTFTTSSMYAYATGVYTKTFLKS